MFDTVLETLHNVLVDPLLRDPYWESVALVGEIIFGGRFIVQWLVSEVKKQSHIPIAFWYLSIVGSLILWVYTLHKGTPVLTAAFSLQIVIYLRNLQLIHRRRHATAQTPPTAT